MAILKKYSYQWWQIGIFKIALLSIGVLIGSYWSEFWLTQTSKVAGLALLASFYILYISLKK